VRFFHWLWRNFGGLFPRLGARNSYFLIAVTTLRNDRGRAFEIANDFDLSLFGGLRWFPAGGSDMDLMIWGARSLSFAGFHQISLII